MTALHELLKCEVRRRSRNKPELHGRWLCPNIRRIGNRIQTASSWLLYGWFSWTWRAVSNPSSTCRGAIMHLRLGTRGSSRLTTSRSALAIVAALRYLLTSFKLLSFLDGREPCWRCARVRCKTTHSFC